MYRIKLLALTLVLGLTAAVSAAGARQDATTKQETKPEAGCCAAHKAGGTAHAHEGKEAAQACDMKGGGCCGPGCCAAHKAEGQQAGAKVPDCCAAHKAGGANAASCCKDGADCCKAHQSSADGKQTAKSCCDGGDCCKAHHKRDATAQNASGQAESCCANCGHSSCCAAHGAGHEHKAGGR